MSELVTVGLVYLASVGFAFIGALVGWALNYTDRAMRAAAACLRFIPWAPIWPFVLARAVGRAMGETLGKEWM